MKKIIVPIILILSFLLNSCGFHLRGPIKLDISSFDIIGADAMTDKKISQRIKTDSISRDKNNPDLIIEFLNINDNKRILSLTGRGQVAEYELIKQVEYRIKTKGIWSENKRLEIAREYSYDPALYAAAAEEERILKETMQEQLINTILTEVSNIQ
ncbi:MAG: LPS assembly lipoprotein LptE [Nitrosomonadales bacterium]